MESAAARQSRLMPSQQPQRLSLPEGPGYVRSEMVPARERPQGQSHNSKQMRASFKSSASRRGKNMPASFTLWYAFLRVGRFSMRDRMKKEPSLRRSGELYR